MGIAITPDGGLAVSGSRDVVVRVWHLNTGSCIATLREHTSGVPAVAITDD